MMLQTHLPAKSCKCFQSKSECRVVFLAEPQNVDGEEKAFGKALTIPPLNDSVRWTIYVGKKGRTWKIKLLVVLPCCHCNCSFSHRNNSDHTADERGLAFSKAHSKLSISPRKTPNNSNKAMCSVLDKKSCFSNSLNSLKTRQPCTSWEEERREQMEAHEFSLEFKSGHNLLC